MRTVFTRGFGAILATMMVVACGPRPEAFPAKTPEQLKQLTEVTDRAMLLARSAEPDAALRQQVIEALNAANPQYRQHSDAIANENNIDAIACTSSQALELGDFETFVERRDAAVRQQDEVTADRRSSMLTSFAMDARKCAVLSAYLLIKHEKQREAIKHGAVVTSEMYAIAAVLTSATNLSFAPLLEDQIRTYETIVAKLGPDPGVQVVSDALPKLKETLAAVLAARRVADHSPTGP